MSEYEEWLKSIGRCTRCRINDAEPSSFLCAPCIEHERVRALNRYNRMKSITGFMEYERQRKRDRYNYLKENRLLC